MTRPDVENNMGQHEKQKGPGDSSRFSKLLACFLGLQVSYVTWGYLQERVMTQEYENGKFSSSAFLVFENRVFALVLACIMVLYSRHNSKSSLGDAPLYAYIPSSLSNSISSWSQYEALKYVSFPSQVLSKSCKIIPVMLVGVLVNGKSYPLLEYFEAILISSGATIFTLFGKSSSHSTGGTDSYIGIGLLLSYLFCDSFTSQWQSKVYKKYGVDQYQMMLGVNFWSIVLTGKPFFCYMNSF
jgi:adenosine 3'-phospho 5'-phosphosulfate transporter B2